MTERAALPDLQQLNPDELKALILAQHQQLLSKDEQLQQKDQQLASRDSEIEQLKLLIAKLQRMQFGRKSEKLEQQIEQLQLRLEALQMNNAEQVAVLPKPAENVNGRRAQLGNHCQPICRGKCRRTCRRKQLARSAEAHCTSWEKTSRRSWSVFRHAAM